MVKPISVSHRLPLLFHSMKQYKKSYSQPPGLINSDYFAMFHRGTLFSLRWRRCLFWQFPNFDNSFPAGRGIGGVRWVKSVSLFAFRYFGLIFKIFFNWYITVLIKKTIFQLLPNFPLNRLYLAFEFDSKTIIAIILPLARIFLSLFSWHAARSWNTWPGGLGALRGWHEVKWMHSCIQVTAVACFVAFPPSAGGCKISEYSISWRLFAKKRVVFRDGICSSALFCVCFVWIN